MSEARMTLEQVRGLVQALVSNYNLPCDRDPVRLTPEGAPFTFCNLGATGVRISMDVNQQPDGRFTCKVYAHTASEMLTNLPALVGLLDCLVGMEAFLQKVLRSLRAAPEVDNVPI